MYFKEAYFDHLPLYTAPGPNGRASQRGKEATRDRRIEVLILSGLARGSSVVLCVREQLFPAPVSSHLGIIGVSRRERDTFGNYYPRRHSHPAAQPLSLSLSFPSSFLPCLSLSFIPWATYLWDTRATIASDRVVECSKTMKCLALFLTFPVSNPTIIAVQSK